MGDLYGANRRGTSLMRGLNSQYTLTAVGLALLIGLLVMAGCAVDKFRLSIDKGTLNPRAAGSATQGVSLE